MRGLGIVRLRRNRSRFARVLDRTGRFSHAENRPVLGFRSGLTVVVVPAVHCREPTRRRRTSFVDRTAIAYDGNDREPFCDKKRALTLQVTGGIAGYRVKVPQPLLAATPISSPAAAPLGTAAN